MKCTKCESENVKERGFYRDKVGRIFIRYRCDNCQHRWEACKGD